MEIQIKENVKETWVRAFKDPRVFVREILEEDLHAGQEEALVGLRDANRGMVTCGNRYGKGEVALFDGCHKCAFKNVAAQFKDQEINALNTSVSQDQANIVFDKFMIRCAEKPRFKWMIEDIRQSPFPHIKLKNKVVWWFRNLSQDGKFLEGRSYFHVNVDEIDLQRNVQRIVNDIIEPRLWDYNGSLCCMGTPRRGKRNAYLVWQELEKKLAAGANDIFMHQGDSRQNKFLHPGAIGRMNRLPVRLFNQNVLGIYEDSESPIPADAIDNAMDIAAGLRREPVAGRRYVHAWDLARASTWCTRATIDITEKPFQLCAYDRFQDPRHARDPEYWKKVEAKIRGVQQKWGGKTALDKTGLGDVVESYLTDISPIGINLGRGKGRFKEDIIENGITTIEHGEIGIPAIEQRQDDTMWRAQDELRDFEVPTDNIIWDFVCALFIGIWVGQSRAVPGYEDAKKPGVLRNNKTARVKGVSKYGTVRRQGLSRTPKAAYARAAR